MIANLAALRWKLVHVVWQTVVVGTLLPIASASAQQIDSKQDVVLQTLFDQYVNVKGKLPTAEVQAAIELVAARGARDRDFMRMVLGELEKRSQTDNDRTIRRNLLAVVSKWLEAGGSLRWQSDQALQARNAERAAGQMPAVMWHANSPMLFKVIELGRLADRSDIDVYVLAVRGAHHPQGESFLLDVLGNRQAGGDPFEFYKHHPAPPAPEKAWSDSMGGSWRDAKFHAAVGLAELGDSRGIEWLIAAVQPNDFGIDGTVYRGTHAKAPGGSLRENSLYVLADLFGLPPTTTGPDWKAWRQKNKQPAVVGRAALIDW